MNQPESSDALPSLQRDLIVVLPGIMGSTLAKDGDLVWAASAGAIFRVIRTFGKSIQSLTLPSGVGDEHPEDGVEPVSLLPDMHVLPGIWTINIGYGALLDWLRSQGLRDAAEDGGPPPNLLPVPYDWRLSNRYNGRRLKTIVEPALERWRAQGGPFAEAKVVFIVHSMGGLVTRWYVEREGGAEITRRVITLGTPHRGALKALSQMVEGIGRDIGPFRLDLTGFARSLPSMHQLLPEYACVESPGGLLKVTETEVPVLDRAMVEDAMRFHDELDSSTAQYELRPFVGVKQATYTTARIVGEKVEAIETIEGDDEGGDATVPRVGATPKRLTPDDPSIRWIPDQHGSLQSNPAVFDELEGVLTARRVTRRALVQAEVGVRVPELVSAGETIPVQATATAPGTTDQEVRVGLEVRIFDEANRELPARPLDPSGVGKIGPLPPGAYRLVVGGAGSAAARVPPVTASVLVWDPTELE